MIVTESTAEILHDLIAIHNDRIEGYERAKDELQPEDANLRPVFNDMEQESRNLKLELERELHETVDVDHNHDDTTFKGKLYRAWMDVKATFSGNSRKSILESCEYGEDAAQAAYKEAIGDTDLSSNVRSLLIEQQRTLMVSHNRIKTLRNSAN